MHYFLKAAGRDAVIPTVLGSVPLPPSQPPPHGALPDTAQERCYLPGHAEFSMGTKIPHSTREFYQPSSTNSKENVRMQNFSSSAAPVPPTFDVYSRFRATTTPTSEGQFSLPGVKRSRNEITTTGGKHSVSSYPSQFVGDLNSQASFPQSPAPVNIPSSGLGRRPASLPSSSPSSSNDFSRFVDDESFVFNIPEGSYIEQAQNKAPLPTANSLPVRPLLAEKKKLEFSSIVKSRLKKESNSTQHGAELKQALGRGSLPRKENKMGDANIVSQYARDDLHPADYASHSGTSCKATVRNTLKNELTVEQLEGLIKLKVGIVKAANLRQRSHYGGEIPAAVPVTSSLTLAPFSPPFKPQKAPPLNPNAAEFVPSSKRNS